MKNYIVNTWKMYLRGLQYIQTTFLKKYRTQTLPITCVRLIEHLAVGLNFLDYSGLGSFHSAQKSITACGCETNVPHKKPTDVFVC